MLIKNNRLLALIVAVPFLFALQVAHAVEDAATDFAIVGLSETFLWQEFRPKSTQIMEETGQRVGVGASWSNGRNPAARGPVYRASALVYGGISEYVGETLISALPDDTTGSYYGVQVDGIGGYRIGSHVGFEFFSGIGFDIWKHSLDGTLTPGYERLFGVINGKLGVGIFMVFERWGVAVRGGAKSPLFVYEHVDVGSGVDLKPIPQASLFGTAEFTSGSFGNDTFSVTGYIDGYNFGASSAKTVNGVATPVSQPMIKTLITGVRVAFNF
jgi:hypothetical protein